MVVSSDRDVWERVVMFHVVAGDVREEFPTDRIPWVANLRMPELLAAVALLQLGRLAGHFLPYGIRERKRMLVAGISVLIAREELTLQEVPDPESDASARLVFFRNSPRLAECVAMVLQAENIGISVGYHPD